MEGVASGSFTLHQQNTQKMTTAENWLIITVLTYCMMNGAQLFETFVLVPKWTAAPPDSFQLFKGPHGLDLKTFWIIAHSIHEITFIMAILFCWKLSPVRNGLLILFLLHFALRVWTLLYFAPNIIAFQKIANGINEGVDLVSKATFWRNMNYLRVGLFIAISLAQVLLWIKLFRLK
jgi:hypothetical protein